PLPGTLPGRETGCTTTRAATGTRDGVDRRPRRYRHRNQGEPPPGMLPVREMAADRRTRRWHPHIYVGGYVFVGSLPRPRPGPAAGDGRSPVETGDAGKEPP